MGSMDEETVTTLDDIRKELRIANQLKFLELTYMAFDAGDASGLTDVELRVYHDLRAKLTPVADTIKQ